MSTIGNLEPKPTMLSSPKNQLLLGIGLIFTLFMFVLVAAYYSTSIIVFGVGFLGIGVLGILLLYKRGNTAKELVQTAVYDIGGTKVGTRLFGVQKEILFTGNENDKLVADFQPYVGSKQFGKKAIHEYRILPDATSTHVVKSIDKKIRSGEVVAVYNPTKSPDTYEIWYRDGKNTKMVAIQKNNEILTQVKPTIRAELRKHPKPLTLKQMENYIYENRGTVEYDNFLDMMPDKVRSQYPKSEKSFVDNHRKFGDGRVMKFRGVDNV